MDFDKELENYMHILNCSTIDICKESKITYSLVNRYINGKRVPKEDGENFNKLVDGIFKIAKKKNINLSKESIYSTLKKALTGSASKIDFDMFVDNLNKLQEELAITTVELAKSVGYDSSFVSRIKNKERKPADIESFTYKVIDSVFLLISQNEQKKHSLISLLNCSKYDVDDLDKFKEIFSKWLCSSHLKDNKADVFNFLSKLDTFDLNEYIGTDFSKVKVPTSPVIIRNSKVFWGIDGRKQAEGEFLKITLLSKSEEPIFFYSDLPISESGNDEEFKTKWIYAMTKLLKKGLKLNMVHNLNRPINELLLGLENWIPIYMTGSISPYYFKIPPSNFFIGSHCTSGSVALSCECLKYNEKKSRFYLTTKKEEVLFEQEKSKYMLSKATPLMDIYKEEDDKLFKEFISKKENSNISKIEKDIFKNIDFCINKNKWIMINKKTSPEIHFVIYHEKLIHAIKTFLLS